MPHTRDIARRNQSAAFSIIPILLLTLIVIGSMSFLARSAFDTNEQNAINLEKRRIELALDDESREFAESLRREIEVSRSGTSHAEIDLAELAEMISLTHKLDFVGIFERSGKAVVINASRKETIDRRIAAAEALLAERRELKTDFAVRRLGMSRTLLDPDAVIAMAAVRIGDTHELVASIRLGEPILARIGANLLLSNLRFQSEDIVEGKAGESTDASVAWNRISDGSFTLESLASIGLLGMAVIGIYGLLVFLHIRRVTRELEHNEAQAKHMAGHDALSGLPNRILFSKRLDNELSRITREGGGLSVMYLDLDKFKEVNDLHGHGAGDKLITMVSRRLGDLLRGADTVARFGGDEFAIIQVGVRSISDTEALAQRILDELRRTFRIDDAEVSIGVSIGISVAPENGHDGPTLMRFADVALYRAKNEGRNRYSFFEQEMNEALKIKKLVEDDLRTAIENNELMLHYQPLVTADGTHIVGMEALVRWNHPTRGLIPPVQFIGIAEERGLITPLGEWVLRQACLDGNRWPGLTVAVNVSPVQFRQPDFVQNVGRILAETGFDPNRLELELTEGVVVEDADTAEVAIIELRAMGVRLALDDFGVGYSSLIYLRRFAFDKIKIDKSFLESMEASGESAILLHSIVHLGRALGLDVTAEGVETEDQRRFLQAVGCHHLQGYYFSRPCPADDMDILVARVNKGRTRAAA